MKVFNKLIEVVKDNWLLILISLVICFLHVYKLNSVPRGLFVDETSIGYNAITIAENGKDEHGVSYPVFFKAFGEYKNPIFIYLTSVIFDIFGYSDFNLRLTSFVFFLIYYIGVVWFASLVFKNKITTILSAFIVGFTPWIFTTSRIAFEVISQLSAFIYIFIFAYKVYFKPRIRYYILLGIMLGVSVYTYSTSRLVSFLLFGYLIFTFIIQKKFKPTGILILAFVTTLIPYIIFNLNNPQAVTARFKSISYVYATDITLSDKIFKFIENYLSYFDLTFLLAIGDPNLRHSSGFLGLIYVSLFVVFLIGTYLIIRNLKREEKRKQYFYLFLLLNLALSPLAAALTNDQSHSLRSILMVNIIVIIGSYGINYLSNLKSKAFLNVFIILIYLESVLFIAHYFTKYPTDSITAFENYNLSAALNSAIKQNPDSITLDINANQSYVNALYYSKTLKSKTLVKEGSVETLNEGECYVYYKWNDSPTNGVVVFETADSLVITKCN